MRNISIKNIKIILFVLTSLCFVNLQNYIIPFIVVIGFFTFFQYYRSKFTDLEVVSLFVSLLVYAMVFTISIFKIYLISLLFFLIYLLIKKKRKYILSYIELLLLVFFVIIVINFAVFKPYFVGLDIYLYFLLIPVLFSLLRSLQISINIYELQKIYINSVLIVSLLLFIKAIFTNTFLISTNTFFSEPAEMTHVYFGLFLGVGCCCLLYVKSQLENVYNKYLDVFIFVLFLSLMMYIGARMAFISTFFCLLIFIYKQKNISVLKKFYLLIAFVFFLIIGFKNNRVQKGINEIKSLYTAVQSDDKQQIIRFSWRNMYMRYLIANYTVKEIKTHPLLGIGIHNTEEKIGDKIIKDGYKYFHKINPHNQFLHIWVSLGIFVFMFFLYLLFFMQKTIDNYYIFYFFILVMFTESLLVRQKGIELFLFFILLYNYKKKYD